MDSESQQPSNQLRQDNENLTTDANATKPETSDSDTVPKVDNIRHEPCDVLIDLKTKHLCFMPVDPASRNHLETLSSFSQEENLSKLNSIDIDLSYTIEESNRDDKEIAEILNRILKGSARYLQKITLCTPIGYLPNVVFPLMKNVIELELQFYWYGSDSTSFTGCLRRGEIFPQGFKFSVFPKLEKVIIELETEGKGPQYYSRFDCWKNNLKSCGIAKSVKHVQYNDECGFSKQQLKTTFPNAKWSTAGLDSTDTTDESSSSEDGSSGWLTVSSDEESPE